MELATIAEKIEKLTGWNVDLVTEHDDSTVHVPYLNVQDWIIDLKDGYYRVFSVHTPNSVIKFKQPTAVLAYWKGVSKIVEVCQNCETPSELAGICDFYEDSVSGACATKKWSHPHVGLDQ